MQKMILLLICVAWLVMSCERLHNKPVENFCKSEFIAFDHIGVEQYHVQTFVISSSKLSLFYIENTIHLGRRYSREFAGRNSLFIDSLGLILEYRYYTTDCNSYLLVRNFILTNSKFFTNKDNYNYGDYNDYCVYIGSKKHLLLHEKTPIFFRELIVYLKKNKADKSLIEHIEDKAS